MATEGQNAGARRADRPNGVSNEMVGILTMGVAMMGVSLASWTTLHGEIADLRDDMGLLRLELRDDIGRLEDRLRAVETGLAVVDGRFAAVEVHTGSPAVAEPEP